MKLTLSFTSGVRSGISTYSWGFNTGVKREFSFVFLCYTFPVLPNANQLTKHFGPWSSGADSQEGGALAENLFV